ncbi:hypothetical protein QO009_002016 [Brevibacillus aydinogluensis]|jgi:hypothetical protein|uniref:hypothetical protein n=1 Tax=Brevibacillus aydinogluensis TaxID=927786 RepID=UPI002892A2C5|nr:hypothetical protein [Brevibacillus aydinogluensis]MDT3416148.1 hypothetical protein [Brevibacillus aydinogluensis]
MKLLREVLVSKLLRQGLTEACGKPVEEASIDELMDEWRRFELERNDKRSA